MDVRVRQKKDSKAHRGKPQPKHARNRQAGMRPAETAGECSAEEYGRDHFLIYSSASYSLANSGLGPRQESSQKNGVRKIHVFYISDSIFLTLDAFALAFSGLVWQFSAMNSIMPPGYSHQARRERLKNELRQARAAELGP